MTSRREFLRIGGAVAATLATAPLLNAAPSIAAKARSLVIIELIGGNDALNTVIPIRDREYYAARPTLAIRPDDALKLDGDAALHPAMREMDQLFTRGMLAIVQGVGYPNPSRSHFRSREIWHRASADARVTTGWLGRWCEGARRSLRQSLAPILQFGQNSVEMFRSRTSAGVAVAHREAPLTIGPRALKVWPVHHHWPEEVFEPTRPLSPEQIATVTGLDVIGAADAVEASIMRPRRPRVQYPESELGKALSIFAQMIVTGSGPRLMHLSQSGYDTHAQQAEMHAEKLAQLSAGLGAFMSDLRAEKRDRDVLVMVFSEFGRRLRENGSAGTDHGSAGTMLFAGGAVNGGLYGRLPSLSDRHDGELKHTTDFRDCYATVLEGWLDADATRILGNGRQRLAFV